MDMSEPIAIIGTACRFAGDIDSPTKLAELLERPQDIRTRIPDSRFCADGFHHPDGSHHGRSNVTHSYLINQDLAAFDAPFFNISSLEAQALDPQQRLLLEIVYEALESAGQTIEGLRGSDTSVFVGAMTSDWEALLLRDLDILPTYSAVGTSRAILSNRVAYFFGWHGAAVSIDTACSSSLVAVHQAVQTLRAGDSQLAVACGTNLILGPENYIFESKLKMLSPDGLSRMWSKNANGYARGDGVAAVLLKTLRKAIADGDSIDCIIRETCVGQDGTTSGLTVPSALAQQSLIQSAYRKAGLDLTKHSDRPQYFEAHGTGTQAGDPIEAEAISTAFFKTHEPSESQIPLYVGSIKTVLGHTEGTAGVAAILKASWALQNSVIPPNLLFDELNPKIAPFISNLEIARSALPWPSLPCEQPRRASVNSFGFGGTNAHAILESYLLDSSVSDSSPAPLFVPYVFSASSQHSLRANLEALATFLDENQVADDDLAYTLHEKRSKLPLRFALPSVPALRLSDAIREVLSGQTSPVGIKAIHGQMEPQILGIFTGQGAQSTGMGRSLVQRSPFAANLIRVLDGYLAELPPETRPSWSLYTQICTDEPAPMARSAVSQPLCTALQIMIVDLLTMAGVVFSSVVGHSSGEIAAAYASHQLSARDAIYVAYYRGLCCTYAKSPNDCVQGAMIAVGTSAEDAKELCEDEDFINRVTIAAVNSASSITISGDIDAIEELEVILADEGKFCRRLQVDQAYHSAHMQPCAQPYIKELQRLSIESLPRNGQGCKWYSSVHDGKAVGIDFPLTVQYWVENLLQPVHFSQAIIAAASSGVTLHAALEVGPHPALQTPASQTLENIYKHPVPYHTTLSRKRDAVEALSRCLGSLWCQFEKIALKLSHFQATLSQASKPACFLKHLPTYQWDHSNRYWHESRKSRRMRLRPSPYHTLLGDPSPDSAPHHLIWKNVIGPREIEWLKGHQVEGQTVLPASAYVSTAIEGAQRLASSGNICLIEVTDFEIHEAVVIDDDSDIEVLIEFSQVSQSRAGHVSAMFSYSAALGGTKGDLVLAASCHVRVLSGEPSPRCLPERQPPAPHMIRVEPDRFYRFMASLGYNFTNHFRSLDTIKRKLGIAQCTTKRVESSDATSLLVHPVDLDAAFQSIAIAHSYPGDGRLRYRHLPTRVGRMRINPAGLRPIQLDSQIEIDTTCRQEDATNIRAGFSGDVDCYFNGHQHSGIQIENVNFRPVMPGKLADRNVFYQTHWIPRTPDGHRAARDVVFTQRESHLFQVLTRIAVFYLRRFDSEVPQNSPARNQAPLCHYLRFARHIVSLCNVGHLQHLRRDWLSDSKDDIEAEIAKMEILSLVDVKVMLLVGEQMPRVFAGTTTMIEQFRNSGLLDEYYAKGLCQMQPAQWLGQVVKQITTRQPHLRIFEIGAGTGSATKAILSCVGRSFDTYTFTDISSGFFESAADVFAEWHDCMTFKPFDVEKDPTEQGFISGSYDVVIAPQVLHATSALDETMRNVRKLLRPGGYLAVAEGNGDGPLRTGAGFIFGALPGWWLGADGGRDLTPFVNAASWDACLKRTGFSGIDTLAPSFFADEFGLLLFVSQAVDHKVEYLRSPLLTSDLSPKVQKLTIIGGVTQAVAALRTKLQSVFEGVVGQISIADTLEAIENNALDADDAVLSLSELESPVFQNLNAKKWYKFRKLWETPRTLVWVTKGQLAEQPFSSMLVGFSRSAAHETEGLRLRIVDFPSTESINPYKLAAEFVQCHTCEAQSSEVLFVQEPEVIIDSDTIELVPRLMPIPAANDRYNSVQNPVSHPVHLSASKVELEVSEGCYCLRELSRFEEARYDSADKTIELCVRYSVVPAIRTQVGYRFLMLATDSQGDTYIHLSPAAKSVLRVPWETALRVDLSGTPEHRYLLIAAAYLVASTILCSLTRGVELVAYDCSGVVEEILSAQAAVKGVRVNFLSSTDKNSKRAIHVLPYLRHADLRRIVPKDTACFVDMRDSDPECEVQIASMLPPGCSMETSSTLYSPEGSQFGATPEVTERNILLELIKNMQQASHSDLTSDIQEVHLQDLVRAERVYSQISVVCWAAAGPVPVRRSRLDSHHMFRSDKTYWLCGMSGALGISLCDWMIDKGVRNLVVTSRNPKIEPQWAESHKDNGITVAILSCDVTDLQALEKLHQHIVNTLPPIAGVVNGAMVLRDSSIGNMEFDQAVDVISPKVQGSLNLDKIFHDVNLDFFILLSSINCVIGNVGQANYAAANMGMVGIAAQRRKRGLNSMAVNVGAIIGIGYITQSDRQLDQVVERMSMMHLSDDDFHQIFAEAMEGGYIDSSTGPEISTGLLDIHPDAGNVPKWYSDPKFAHFISPQSTGEDAKRELNQTSSIQEQLSSCKSRSDITLVVQKAFCAQLRRILHASTTDDDLLAMCSAELGLDSLISVDIRGWVLKVFQVNIPVLQIMASDTHIFQLIETVSEGVPLESTPGVVAGSAPVDPIHAMRTVNGKKAMVDAGASPGLSLTNGYENGEAGAKIDWLIESQLAEDYFLPQHHHQVPRLPPRVIVLTGMSGLLGHHLLEHLLRDPMVELVHCIAIRRLEERLQKGEIPAADSRARYYEGDLRADRFGLSDLDAESIFSECDAIIHNGSDTSHLKYYTDVRDANVVSTRRILGYAIPRKIPVHYVSSAGVALLTDLDVFPEISATAIGRHPPADGAHGYMCSKWVSERLLEQASAGYGLPVWIHRPSTIIREGDDATTSQAEFDWVNALMHYSHIMQTVPVTQYMKGAFDLVYMESVCTDIVQALSAARSTEVTYINNVGDVVVSLEHMADIGKRRGQKYQTLPLHQWAKKAITVGLHPAVATLIELYDEPGVQKFPSFVSRKRRNQNKGD